MAQTTASIQLIVFGARGGSDLPGVLNDVKTAGFPAIEAGNLFASHGETETRRILDATGLRVSGAHFGYGDYADGSKLDAHIAYAKAVGLQNFMCSGVADTKTVEGYKKSAQVFNEVGKRLKDEGLTFNYHNHAWEFETLDGGTNGMAILSGETDPELVKYNLDVFWIWYAGADPVSFISQHRDRAGYFHFKDGRRTTDAGGKPQPEFLELGRGEVDLKAAMQAAQEVGATWAVAEQDNTKLPVMEAITISRNYLRDELGV